VEHWIILYLIITFKSLAINPLSPYLRNLKRWHCGSSITSRGLCYKISDVKMKFIVKFKANKLVILLNPCVFLKDKVCPRMSWGAISDKFSQHAYVECGHLINSKEKQCLNRLLHRELNTFQWMFSPSLGKSKSLLHDQGHQPEMQNKEVNDMAIITPVAVTMTTNTAATTTNKIRLL
jgi:hypothetical protein